MQYSTLNDQTLWTIIGVYYRKHQGESMPLEPIFCLK